LAWPGSDASIGSPVGLRSGLAARSREDASPSLWRPSGPSRGTSHWLSSLCAGRQQCRPGGPRGFDLGCLRFGLHRDTDVRIWSPGEPQGCQRVRWRRLVGVLLRGRSCGCPRPVTACRDCVVHLLPRSFSSCRSGQPGRQEVRAAPPQPPRRGSFVRVSSPSRS